VDRIENISNKVRIYDRNFEIFYWQFIKIDLNLGLLSSSQKKQKPFIEHYNRAIFSSLALSLPASFLLGKPSERRSSCSQSHYFGSTDSQIQQLANGAPPTNLEIRPTSGPIYHSPCSRPKTKPDEVQVPIHSSRKPRGAANCSRELHTSLQQLILRLRDVLQS
jgi:hypothetical protein